MNQLSWNCLGLAVSDKQILSNNSGSATSQQVIAIIGGSGAGKSTLLECISGRITAQKAELTGNVAFNGAPRDPKVWLSTCSFVEQDCHFIPTLTVHETVLYAAKFKCPNQSTASLAQLVDTVILQLGLTSCRDTRIGDFETKGISGGERKRLSIAIELVSKPAVLLLDEPTSGLDAFTAFNIIESIKTISQQQNIITIVTIHQPRTDILGLFDKVLLLSSGQTLWYGSVPDMISHFSDLGFPLPPHTNPSDFLLDITTLDQRSSEQHQESSQRIQQFVVDFQPFRPEHCTETFISIPTFRKNSFVREFTFLLQRHALEMFRDKTIIFTYLGQSVVILLFLSALFYNLPLNHNGIQDRLGVLFFVCIQLSYGIVMPNIVVFVLQRAVIQRERSSGTYRASTAFLSKVFVFFPLVTLLVVITCFPLYWIIKLQNDMYKFLIYSGIVLLQAHTASAFGFMIASIVPNVMIGQIAAPLCLVVMMLFAGQLINLNTVPAVFRWIQYISFIAYSNKALAQNEFYGLVFPCAETLPECTITGEEIISKNSLDNVSIWQAVTINSGFTIAFYIAGYIAFSLTCSKRLKLQ
jgi:ABC-type multidrug transport system ATPase subunit/ABC-type multidrug transport system permease subunit